MFHPDIKAILQEAKEEHIAEMRANYVSYSQALHKHGSTVEELIEMIDQQSKSPEFAQDLIRINMLQVGTGLTDNVQTKIGNLLLSKKWFIYQARNSDSYITSDNPGFAFDGKNREFANLAFRDNFEFNFPITPTETLVILSSYNENKNYVSKEIIFQDAIPAFVKSTNINTLKNVYKHIYSNSENNLINVIGDFKRMYPDYKD